MRTTFARTSIDSQLNNQRAVLRHLALRRTDNSINESSRERIKVLQAELKDKEGVEQIRGIEGLATKEFLKALRTVLKDEVEFTKRSARSGRDPFNITLDICGGLLASTCRSAVEASGLDPFKGVLHGTSRNGPALALDLEDVYRPFLVAAVCVALFTKDVLGEEDFVAEDNGYRITKTGVNKVCRQFGCTRLWSARSTLGVRDRR
jgi:CRISPR-associated protein Cas1